MKVSKDSKDTLYRISLIQCVLPMLSHLRYEDVYNFIMTVKIEEISKLVNERLQVNPRAKSHLTLVPELKPEGVKWDEIQRIYDNSND